MRLICTLRLLANCRISRNTLAYTDKDKKVIFMMLTTPEVRRVGPLLQLLFASENEPPRPVDS